MFSFAISAQDTIKSHIKFVHYISAGGSLDYHLLKTNHALTDRKPDMNDPRTKGYVDVKDFVYFNNIGWQYGFSYSLGFSLPKDKLSFFVEMGLNYSDKGKYYMMLSPISSNHQFGYPNEYSMMNFFYYIISINFKSTFAFNNHWKITPYFGVDINQYYKSKESVYKLADNSPNNNPYFTIKWMINNRTHREELDYFSFSSGIELERKITHRFWIVLKSSLITRNSGPLSSTFFISDAKISNKPNIVGDNQWALVQLHNYSYYYFYPSFSLKLKFIL